MSQAEWPERIGDSEKVIADPIRGMRIRPDGEGDVQLEGPLCDQRIGVGDEVPFNEAAGIDFEAGAGGVDGFQKLANGGFMGFGDEGIFQRLVDADDVRVAQAVVAAGLRGIGEAPEISVNDLLI